MRLALHHNPDLPSLMILMFLLLVLVPHLWRVLDRQVHLDYHQDSTQLLHLLVGEKEQELNMHRVSDHDHDLHQRSLNTGWETTATVQIA